MAAFTPTEFKDRASPAFDAIDEADVQLYLDMAACFVSESNWGPCKYPHGIYYLTGHFLTFEELLKAANANGIGGGTNAVPAEVHAERIKSWAVTYANGGGDASDDDALSRTSWGRQYMSLRKLVFSVRCI